MRNYLLLFMVFFLFGCNADSENDASKRNADWVWWVDEHTGKGEWIKSGDQTTVKDGKYTMFYYNGNVFEKGKLKNGERVDTCFYFDNLGNCYGFKPSNKNEIKYYYYKNGPLKIYFNTGELNGEGIIANNRREKWIGYLKTGQVVYRLDYTNGAGWCKSYFDNGQPHRIFYSLGYDSLVLDSKIWNENGQLILDAQIENGDYNGSFKEYFDNGNLKLVFNYQNGLLYGDQIEYFENGNKETLRQYFNDTLDGDAIDYYSDGKIKNQAYFKKRKLNGFIRMFYENGKQKLIGSYLNNLLEGKLEKFDSTGKLISTETYQNGERLN